MRLAGNASVPAGGPFIALLTCWRAFRDFLPLVHLDFRACWWAFRGVLNVTAGVSLQVRAQLLPFCASSLCFTWRRTRCILHLLLKYASDLTTFTFLHDHSQLTLSSSNLWGQPAEIKQCIVHKNSTNTIILPPHRVALPECSCVKLCHAWLVSMSLRMFRCRNPVRFVLVGWPLSCQLHRSSRQPVTTLPTGRIVASD